MDDQTPAVPEKLKDRGKPDAIKCPPGIASGATPHQRGKTLKDRFGPVLGGPMVHAAHQGNFVFLRLDPSQALNHPTWHPSTPGQPRYDWVDQGNGVEYGYLIPDEAADADQ